MKLQEYQNLPDAKSLQQLADESGVSYQTLKAVARGMKLKFYDVAKRISDACGPDAEGRPLVSVTDLCEEDK